MNPGTLAWVLDQIAIGPQARVPGELSASELDEFRRDLVARLRRMAFPGSSC